MIPAPAAWLLAISLIACAAPSLARDPPTVIDVDVAHFNFHTTANRYQGFAQTLAADGYTLRNGIRDFSAETLKDTRLLVIPSALAARNRKPEHWSPPIDSAFTADEILAITTWVHQGGGLLLVTDHTPWAGASKNLAAAFGFDLIEGYALDRREIRQTSLDRPFVFTREGIPPADGRLMDHEITRGRNATERVDRVMTFMGTAFRAPAEAAPLLMLGEFVDAYQPEQFGRLSESTPSLPANGLAQGAARTWGKGRVVLFSEAGIFSTQRQADKPVGLSHPGATGNRQLLLNVMRWLSDR